MIDLDEIEKACREATGGPWRVKWAKHHEASHSEHWIVGADGAGLSIAYRRGEADGEIGQDQLDKDIMFAANARSWVPALVERVRELEALDVRRLHQIASAHMEEREACATQVEVCFIGCEQVAAEIRARGKP